MKTAEQVISDIKELPVEEQLKVADYLNAQEENYSDEDIAKILQAGEDAEKGIGVSPELEGEDAVNFLRNLRDAK